MKKSTLVQITLALVIALVYVYLFGVTGRVPSVMEEENGEQQTESQTVTANEETTPYETENGDIPTYTIPPYSSTVTEGLIQSIGPNVGPEPDVMASLPFDITEQDGFPPLGLFGGTTEETTGEDSDITTIGEAETEPEETTTEETTTTTAETTTTTTTAETTTTTTEATTTTTTEATTKPSDNDPSGMTFKVYDQVHGVYAEGDGKDILAQVVMGEIGDIFADEAIKAQIVAAYTYVKKYNDHGEIPNVAMRDASSKMYRLVDEVFGEGIYYNGELIQAVYSASTAGYTASSLNTWGVDYPYLQSVRCELDDLYDPYFGATKSFSSSVMKDKVKTALGISLSGDPSDWFEIKSYVDHVYVGTISVGGQTTYVNGSGRTVTITGNTMRNVVMGYGINSTSFKIDYDKSTDKFTFTTYGYGHGVGLSQYGAHFLAKYKGYDYKQILEFYFQGAYVV